MGLRRLLTTLGLGAGFMYFYDPEMGNRRRALLRDSMVKYQNDWQDLWQKGTRDLRNRAQGMQARANSVMQGTGGGSASNMAGAGQDKQLGWMPGARLLAVLAGAGLSLYGLLNRGFFGRVFTLSGLLLAVRGFTNQPLSGMMGRKSGQAIDIHKTITVNAPIQEVFAFWRNYPNFSRFMAHVREVQDLGNGRSHWIVEGPAGVPVEWDAVITELEPDRLLAWESLPNSQVFNAGRVRFTPSDGGTRLDVHMKYRPLAGAIGHAFASIFGTDPKSAMDDDLLRFKSIVEKGKTTAGGETVRREQILGETTESQHASVQQDKMGATAGQFNESFEAESRAHEYRTESGMPGGGQGRVDEIGRSGVYPASGPLPEGDAEVHGMASWGQGDRGAAGYEDSGRSELGLGEETGFESHIPGPSGEQEDEEKA